MYSRTSSRSYSIESSACPSPPGGNKQTPPFRVLVDLFEKLSIERKTQNKRTLLSKWFAGWRETVGNDLYPLLRLILPHLDKRSYTLKENLIAKAYISLFYLESKGKQNQHPDALKLLKWTQPSENNETPGDFASVVYSVASTRSSVVEASVSIKQVNDILDDLEHAAGAFTAQKEIFRKIFMECLPIEQKWIVRIILKNMSISVKEQTVFPLFHPDAQDLYNVTSSLQEVAWRLHDFTRRSDEDTLKLQIFRAFKPMLCSTLKTVEDCVKEMGGAEFIIEEKLDGERMQLHVDLEHGSYFYCSRKGTNYNYLYGKDAKSGSLSPHLQDVFDSRIFNIILDGEMVAIDTITGQVLPFGTLKDAASGNRDNAPSRPCFLLFDVVLVNNTPLIEKPLTYRKRALRRFVKEKKGYFEFLPEYRGRTAQDIRTKLEEVMDKVGEGLVIKHPSSTYVVDGRNFDWFKVKPEHMDGLAETFDLLVVAGNYGHGARGGKITSLLCVLKDNDHYRTFVRIGSGLNSADHDRILKMNWKPTGSGSLPSWIKTLKKTRKTPKDYKWHKDELWDAYLDFADTFVLEVKATEIIASDQHDFEYSLRFPRAIRIRDDLGSEDCWTAARILQYLHSETSKKRKISDSTEPQNPSTKTVAKKKQKTSDSKPQIYQPPSVKRPRQVLASSWNAKAAVVAKEPIVDDHIYVKSDDGTKTLRDMECDDVTTKEERPVMSDELDPASLFKLWYFYFDSPENATREGMVVKKDEKIRLKIHESFLKIKKLVVENGGQVVDLNDPRLTHIVFDTRDLSRRVELNRRTAQPKYRRLILSEYIEASIAEETLLNEEDYAPR